MKNSIVVTNLSKQYRHRPVVKNLKFQVPQGQIFAFIGPNGAGKSTTMNILTTLVEKSAGSIQIEGLDLDHQKTQIKEKIGVVFQNDILDEELSVYENLMFRGGLYLPEKKALRERIESIASSLDLTLLYPKKYGTCSGGQRRLVQIARALLAEPALLILDEPTTGLDPATRNRVWEVLLSLKEQRRLTIFFSTHYMEEAAYADQLCFLHQGNALLCGPLEQVLTNRASAHSPLALRGASLESLYCTLLKGAEQE